jgi:serine/threonine protein kinase
VFGERIDHYVRNRRMPLPERLALLEAVCEAVAYAHARQLIHRDIKPGNLLVDETGRPRLLDFGIATSDDDDEEEGVCAMTPVYASPEQFAGDVVTFASDVYQLGALLRALTLPDGQPCATLPRMPRAIIINDLEAVAARATRIEAGDRYASVSALRADIAAIRQRRCTSMSGNARHKTRLFVERHAVACLCGGVGTLALATAWLTMRA